MHVRNVCQCTLNGSISLNEDCLLYVLYNYDQPNCQENVVFELTKNAASAASRPESTSKTKIA